MIKHIAVFVLLFVMFNSCKNKTESISGPTQGSINVYVDRCLEGIINQEKLVFENNYPQANINLIVSNETDIIKSFMNDSVDLMIVSRALDSSEIKFLLRKNNVARHYEIAKTAIAFIAHRSSVDSNYTFEAIKDFFSPNSNSTTPVVIENSNSGIGQHLLRQFQLYSFSPNIFAAQNKPELLNYLDQNPKAIACIDWSDISDSDDPAAQALLHKYRLLAITRPKDSTQCGYIHPYQYNLQDNKYPFIRDIYVISRTGRSDLGLGFAAFIDGEIGQKIILKAGLLPKYQFERLIELKNQNFKVVN